MTPTWVEEAVAIAIHRRQLAEHGGKEGIRDRGLLESALYRAKNKLAYDNSSIFDMVTVSRRITPLLTVTKERLIS